MAEFNKAIRPFSRHDMLIEIIDGYFKYALRYTFPLAIKWETEQFEIVGSATSVTINNGRYLLTATHVLEYFIQEKAKAWVGTSTIGRLGEGLEIPGNYAEFPCLQSSKEDIALIPAEFLSGKISFVSQSKLAKGDVSALKGDTLLIGYPIFENPDYKVSLYPGSMETGIKPLLLKLDATVDFASCGMDRSMHLGFVYNKIAEQNSPSLHPGKTLEGYSGGGMWFFKRGRAPRNGLLAGVFTDLVREKKLAFGSQVRNLTKLF